jgi:SulP family sulfate permease
MEEKKSAAKFVATKLKENWKSGITVSLVSVPLSVSLAIAGGATPLMGIITAVWAGLFAAIFGGSNFNIVGPTGALSGLLLVFAINNGVDALSFLAIATGLVVLAIWALKLEKYIVFIPASVLHGFTLGVAFIIGLNQLNFALGLSKLPQHEKFILNVWESLQHISQISVVTFVIFVVGLALLLVLAQKFPKTPWAIVLAVVGIVIGYFSSRGSLPFTLQTLETRYGDISGSLIHLPHFTTKLLNMQTLVAVLAVSLIAVLETLISAKIADGMTKTRFHQRKEIFGLAIANIGSGLFGGIPATAALARTSLNVKTQATHKTSAFVSSVFVALIAVVFLAWFKYLPLAVVASILVFVAIRMVSQEHFIHLYKHDKIAFGVSMLVTVITIVQDPTIGILVGAIVALLISANKISESQAEFTILKSGDMKPRHRTHDMQELEKHGDVLVYRVAGQLIYMNGLSHQKNIESISDSIHTVIISLRNMFYVDVDGLDALREMIETLQVKGKKFAITGVNSLAEPMLFQNPWFSSMRANGHVFDSTTDALEKIVS